jgi:hypothetical protein
MTSMLWSNCWHLMVRGAGGGGTQGQPQRGSSQKGGRDEGAT